MWREDVEFGKRLKEFFDGRNARQCEVARLIDVTPSSIHHYTHGRRTIKLDSFVRIMEEYNATTSEVMYLLDAYMSDE